MDTNKMRDISREQFEEVFQAKFPRIYAAAKAGESKAHGDMSIAWWGWQASRESVVVELPGYGQPDCEEHAEWHHTRNGTIDACARMIEAQGLKVAP